MAVAGVGIVGIAISSKNEKVNDGGDDQAATTTVLGILLLLVA